MILRRAENLSTDDRISYDGDVWNVSGVATWDDRVEISLTRSIGYKLNLTLLNDDLVRVVV